MLHIRTSLFVFIMSLGAHSYLHGSQALVKAFAEAFIYAGCKGEDGYKFIKNAIQDNKIDVNAQNERGSTALHYAIGDANLNIAKLLLEKCPDIDVNLADHTGKTPVELALKNMYGYMGQNLDAKVNGVQTILELLVASNANCPDLTNPRCCDDKNWYHEDEFYNIRFYNISKSAYENGKKICEQREKERAAYEQGVANQIDQYIPVKDLNKIISEYTDKMSVLQFVYMQKEQAKLQTQK